MYKNDYWSAIQVYSRTLILLSKKYTSHARIFSLGLFLQIKFLHKGVEPFRILFLKIVHLSLSSRYH